MDRQLTSCPTCGASNQADARWCSQCYAELERAAARATGWTCRTCGNVNPPSRDGCGTCGTSIYETFRPPSDTALPREAVRASLVPGLGLARVGMAVEGALAAVLVVFAVVAGLFVVSADNGGGWVLVVAGLCVWLVAARDAYVVSSRTGDAWLGGQSISVAAGVIIITAAILILRTPLGGAG